MFWYAVSLLPLFDSDSSLDYLTDRLGLGTTFRDAYLSNMTSFLGHDILPVPLRLFPETVLLVISRLQRPGRTRHAEKHV